MAISLSSVARERGLSMNAGARNFRFTTGTTTPVRLGKTLTAPGKITGGKGPNLLPFVEHRQLR